MVIDNDNDKFIQRKAHNYYRAFKICSQDLLQEELSHLKNQFINNNYPKKIGHSRNKEILTAESKSLQSTVAIEE